MLGSAETSGDENDYWIVLLMKIIVAHKSLQDCEAPASEWKLSPVLRLLAWHSTAKAKTYLAT
jgi:hypothetical protein